MTINLNVPQNTEIPALQPRITVIGVGGAGGNAVNNMIASGLEGVDFVVANTDAQALAGSRADRRVQLGANITQGLGAGSRPDVGRAAAEEALDQVLDEIQGSNMVFIAAGMGGGTGTGGAPVISRAAREQGILTVGVVTKPFQFEGAHRMRLADQGIEELEQFVDTLIIIPNQNLFRVANEKTTFADAFSMADEVLYSGVRGVTDLMVMPGLVNLDFADIRFVMAEMGKAMMGTGEAEGERRALDAAEAAISNPLLDDTSMAGAKGVLINITGGMDMTLFEVDEAANRIRSEVDGESYIIFGSTFDESLQGKVRVSVVATGMDREAAGLSQPTLIDLTASKEAATDGGGEEEETVVAEDIPAVAHGDSLAAVIDNGLDIPASIPAPVVERSVATVVSTPDPVISRQARKPGAPPAATPSLGAKEAFIPPPPARRDGGKRLERIDPFAAAVIVNGPAPNSHQARQVLGAADQKPPRRKPTLFETVTGIGRAAKAKKADKESAKAKEVPATVKPAPEVTMTAAKEAVGEGTRGLKAAGPAKPSPEEQAEEDLLDIPAFLRRQAN
ncbi:MAG TPA: cell division protein FtsZ [Alphaproteobacteria bacterium]|nr:cell division protein FtsZ [Alphaproteobacteria bacterium]